MKHVMLSKSVRPFVECSCGKWSGMDTEFYRTHIESVVAELYVELENLRAENSRLNFAKPA